MKCALLSVVAVLLCSTIYCHHVQSTLQDSNQDIISYVPVENDINEKIDGKKGNDEVTENDRSDDDDDGDDGADQNMNEFDWSWDMSEKENADIAENESNLKMVEKNVEELLSRDSNTASSVGTNGLESLSRQESSDSEAPLVMPAQQVKSQQTNWDFLNLKQPVFQPDNTDVHGVPQDERTWRASYPEFKPIENNVNWPESQVGNKYVQQQTLEYMNPQEYSDMGYDRKQLQSYGHEDINQLGAQHNEQQQQNFQNNGYENQQEAINLNEWIQQTRHNQLNYLQGNGADIQYSQNSHYYGTNAQHIITDGRRKRCFEHSDCYDLREPVAWCRLRHNQRWTDKGCYCDDRLKECIIERDNQGTMEYTECLPKNEWECSTVPIIV